MKQIDIICFGGSDWWYHNRGHIDMQLMRRFAKMGTTLYVNSIVMQKPKPTRWTGDGKSLTHKLIRKTKSIFRGLRKSDAGFWVYSPLSLPVHHISWLRHINKIILQFQLWLVTHKLGIRNPLVWVTCPAAVSVAVNMKRSGLVYLRADMYEEFPGVDPEAIKEYDQQLKTAADLTIFVNRTLYEKESNACKKAIYVDHGVNFEMFASAKMNRKIPADIANVPKPIVGFFGQIEEHTVDIGFLEKVIDYLPKISFVFIGGIDADCSGLLAKKNVWMLGQKPYEQIPHYGKCFDVAIMPWRQNRWIEACNPIKLKEYLALGKPIVSTPFPELRKYSGATYAAKTPEEFAKCTEKALIEDDTERIVARRRKVEKATWDSKAQLVLKELFGNVGGMKESN